MNRILKDGRIADDPWRRSEAGDDFPLARAAAGEPLIVPLAAWLRRPDDADPARLGVLLSPGDEPDALLPQLARIPLIAIDFPVFTDGRGYSLAHLLRVRHRYRGELRAVGDVLRDQIYLLHRCGFDAFRLRADQSLDEARGALRDYAWTPVTAR